jgi:hypothetical protein
VIVKTLLERLTPKPRSLPEGCDDDAVGVGGQRAAVR